MEILRKTWGIFLLVFLFEWNGVFVGRVESVSLEEDLKLSIEERQVLNRFKRRVIPILPHKYMKEDIYLIRWLRARNFNINLAEQMLKNNLRWRREQRIDTIHQEDWSDMIAEFPYYNDKFDKEGRPLGAVSLGPWNFRKMAVTGKMPRMQRYLAKLLEEIVQRVIEEQYKGKNVTQAKLILNMEGFNQIQHACPLCLPAYTSFVVNYEEHYPGFADEVIHINTPPVYDIVLNAVRPLFSPHTRKVVKIFNDDKNLWMKYLDKTISRDQRRVEFGGTLKEGPIIFQN